MQYTSKDWERDKEAIEILVRNKDYRHAYDFANKLYISIMDDTALMTRTQIDSIKYLTGMLTILL